MGAPETWVIVGASRGIGLEFVRQLLEQGNQVIAAVRNPETANGIWQLSAGAKQEARPAACLIEQCDVTDPKSIDRATEMSFDDFALHLHTNTIGPIIAAQKLLNISGDSPPSKVVFISSDSGSTADFREHEDGFAAYGASKAALNQMLRHMAAELKRKGGKWKNVCVLAMHPGEVQTDMANINVEWEVEGVIKPDESVEKMLKVIADRDKSQSGTFWRWDGRQHPW